ncbi:helix-turn-helix domain-containing protein [Streptomyces sp. NPDC059534]|uniref:helix-turn-helix domain-containing protein n=1 Tax=Streptomyces sp. NPDC059534 TaxID=3346859 RepID=UPI0036C8ED1E
MPTLLCARDAWGPEEERAVTRLASARKAPADLVMRARIIALSWEGMRVAAIATELGCHAKTVRWWLHRFNESGLEGLEDRLISGRPRRITEAERSRIVALVRRAPPGRLTRGEDGELAADDEAGTPEWTLESLAEAARKAGISVGRSQVRRILLAEGVRWRRTRSWVRSKDRDFEGKGRGSSASTPTRPTARRSSVPTSSGR